MVEEPTQSNESIKSNLIRSNPDHIVEPSLRRSSRAPRQLDRYGFLVQNGDPVEVDENNENSIIYIDVMQRSDFDKWLEAMKSKIVSTKDNNVWTLVDPPKRIKLIGYK